MASGGKREGSGRPVGAKGKTYAAIEFAEKVENRLRKDHGKDYSALGVHLLTCGHPPTIAKVWLHLQEMRYGKPVQAVEGKIEHEVSMSEKDREDAKKIVAKLMEE